MFRNLNVKEEANLFFLMYPSNLNNIKFSTFESLKAKKNVDLSGIDIGNFFKTKFISLTKHSYLYLTYKSMCLVKKSRPISEFQQQQFYPINDFDLIKY